MPGVEQRAGGSERRTSWYLMEVEQVAASVSKAPVHERHMFQLHVGTNHEGSGSGATQAQAYVAC